MGGMVTLPDAASAPDLLPSQLVYVSIPVNLPPSPFLLSKHQCPNLRHRVQIQGMMWPVLLSKRMITKSEQEATDCCCRLPEFLNCRYMRAFYKAFIARNTVKSMYCEEDERIYLHDETRTPIE